MPRQVTYGVAGLIDWHAILPVGKARLSVHFTGGALTKYGVTPAEFTTCDPLTQRVIEESAYYRNGRITTLRTVGKADVPAASRRQPVETVNAGGQAQLPLEQPQNYRQPSAETKEIKVACIEDAIEYMREHHNIPSVRIRNMESLQSVAGQFGISFSIS